MPGGASEHEIEMVYRSRFTQFVSVANAIVHDREHAKDAVQDAFAAALTRKHQWLRTGSLEGWLWRAVVNAAHDRRRRRARGIAAEEAAVDGQRTLTAFDAEGDRRSEAIASAIAALPERQRMVLFLRYYGDLEYSRIAEVLDLKTGTVAATIHQAQVNLKRGLRLADDRAP